MDKETAKLVLGSYRPEDAADPIFAEALGTAAADSDLAEWFAEMRGFDAVMASKLGEVTVPADLQSHILLGYHAASLPAAPRRRGRPWMLTGSIAALLLAGLFSWQLLAPRPRPTMNPLALQAISYTDKMPALQFVCFDPAEVAKWINHQPGSQKVGLKLPTPPASMSMGLIGSSMVDWNGHPVVMICLQHGQQMAMLYVLKSSDAAALQGGAPGTYQQADWVVRTSEADGQVRVLTTKGGPDNLDFPVPF